jgi:hypothetical protein
MRPFMVFEVAKTVHIGYPTKCGYVNRIRTYCVGTTTIQGLRIELFDPKTVFYWPECRRISYRTVE